MVAVYTRLPRELADELASVAAAHYRSTAAEVRRVLEQHLARERKVAA
jgi:plasmid stability protein